MIVVWQLMRREGGRGEEREGERRGRGEEREGRGEEGEGRGGGGGEITLTLYFVINHKALGGLNGVYCYCDWFSLVTAEETLFGSNQEPGGKLENMTDLQDNLINLTNCQNPTWTFEKVSRSWDSQLFEVKIETCTFISSQVGMER